MNRLHTIPDAPMPSERTLRRRKNPFYQFVRFVSLGLKMMRMLAKGHSH